MSNGKQGNRRIRIFGAALAGGWPVGALAVTLGQMAEKAAADLNLVPGLIAALLYVVGGCSCSLGC